MTAAYNNDGSYLVADFKKNLFWRDDCKSKTRVSVFVVELKFWELLKREINLVHLTDRFSQLVYGPTYHVTKPE